MHRIWITTAALLCGLSCCMTGCAIVEVGVSNPAPNLSRIAVAPFVNLSPERSVDGRRFAEAYYTELQKIPGFQVIPVGVVETAIVEHQLNLDSPADMLRLTEILDADGICFGAITEYTPYYPPRLGLQVSWYTPGMPDFQPGIAIDPELRRKMKAAREEAAGKSWWNRCVDVWPSTAAVESHADPLLIRAQNDDQGEETKDIDPLQTEWEKALAEALQLNYEKNPRLSVPVQIGMDPPAAEPKQSETELTSGQITPQMLNDLQVYAEPQAFEPLPYMSYTRVFDGADADFTASLRNYLELSGDQRSGGWTGHLHRSEDFIRFCMHRMILEMLQLHGGESRKRYVLATRRYD